MSRYRKIDTRIHGDEKFRKLSRSKPCGQALWYYLLVPREATNLPGVIVAGESTLAENLGWNLSGFRKAMSEIVELNMAFADWGSRLVFLPNAIKYDPPANHNVIQSWTIPWDEVPECQLKRFIFDTLRNYISKFRGDGLLKTFDTYIKEPFHEGLVKPLNKRLEERLQEPSEERYGESVTVAVTVTESDTGVPVPSLPDLSIPENHTVRSEAGTNGDKAKNFKNLWMPVLGHIRSYVDRETFNQCGFESSRIVGLSGDFVTIAVPERLIQHQGGQDSAARRLYALIAQAQTGLMRGRGLKLITIEKLIQQELGNG